MATRKDKAGRPANPGWFKPGPDPRRRRGFTTEECRRGYQAALDAAWSKSAHLAAWVGNKVRGFYRARTAGRAFDWSPAARRARQVGSPKLKESVA